MVKEDHSAAITYWNIIAADICSHPAARHNNNLERGRVVAQHLLEGEHYMLGQLELHNLADMPVG